jgi:nucleotide-binding universal stress UspA family protein
MTTNWIVGIDGSDDARHALAWAAGMAERVGGTVEPVSAWHLPLPIWATAGRRMIDVDRMGLQAEAEVMAARTVEAIGSPSVVGEPRVDEGNPAEVLLAHSADDTTIVVGRRGISDLKHRLLGSVSQYVATHASGPVVVVPADWSRQTCERIVVGFDGSEHAEAALRWAIEVAPDEASVVAVIAIDVIPWLRPEAVEERYPDEVAAARERILAAAERADPRGRAERSVVLHGPRQAFAEAWGDADLIVVGPRGIGGVARAILGSVTTWLLHSAPCPVAVIPSN